MDLDDFILAVFCVVDEAVPHAMDDHRLRPPLAQPVLVASEVITMEVVGRWGEYLGLEQDSALFAYFRQHYAHFFPALCTLHRTTFVRQAANLLRLKERLWQRVLARIPHDPTFGISSIASRCRSVSSRAPHGTLVGDRNSWSPTTVAEWQPHGVELLAPYRSAQRDPHPRWSALLSRVRYSIDTVFGQLVDRCDVKQFWARGLWHLCSRLLRKVLMHTVAVLLNIDLGLPPLDLARLVA